MIYILILVVLLYISYKYYLKNKKTIIENNQVIFKNLNVNYGIKDLIKDLELNDINSFKEIKRAYLFNNKLKIISNKPSVIISKGKIDYNALNKTDKNIISLMKILNEKHLKLEDIFYAVYLDNNFYIVKNT